MKQQSMQTALAATAGAAASASRRSATSSNAGDCNARCSMVNDGARS